ncbi:putative subtilisin [Fusarium bulbicola]|nr:putative subtilisin [Fusarium bulbicola]
MASRGLTTLINGNFLTLEGESLPVGSVTRSPSMTGSSSSQAVNKPFYILVTLSDDSGRTQKAIEQSGAEILVYFNSAVYLCRWDLERDISVLRKVNGVRFVDEYPDSIKVSADLGAKVKLVTQSMSTTEAAQLGSSAPSSHGSGSTSTGGAGAAAGELSKRIRIEIHFHRGVRQSVVEATSSDLISKQVIMRPETSVFGGMISTTISPGALELVAAIAEVRVIERAANPSVENNFATDVLCACGPALLEGGFPYTGEGEAISIGDTGFDRGDGGNLDDMSTIHPCFTPPTGGYKFHCMMHDQPKAECFVDTAGHGTHVCGSAVGSSQGPSTMGANKNGYIKGAAPKATLIFTQLKDTPEDSNTKEMYKGPMIDIYSKTAVKPYPIFSQSWGDFREGLEQKLGYTTSVENLDSQLRRDDVLVCWSSGNDAERIPNDISVGLYACGKNVLTVGACLSSANTGAATDPATNKTYYRSSPSYPPGDPFKMAALSCWGTESGRPVRSTGRQKPDVVAPGVCILSARSRNIEGQYLANIDASGTPSDKNYCFKSGTSMATPLVAGCAAVLNEGLKKTHENYTLSGVLLKALLINGAVPFSPDDQYVKGTFRPWGFGRVNLQGSLKHLANGDPFSTYKYGEMEAHTRKSWEVAVGAPKTVSLTGEILLPSLKVTLVYADEGSVNLICLVALTLTENKTGKVLFGNSKTWISAEEYKAATKENTKMQALADCQNNVQQISCSGLAEGIYEITIDYHKNNLHHIIDIPYGVAWAVSEAESTKVHS